MFSRTLLSCFAIAGLSSGTAHAHDLMEQLPKGGHIIFFRHAERDKVALPTVAASVDNAAQCMPGTELTAHGVEDTTAIIEKLKALNVKIDKVYTSPTCRTQQMAKAFGPEFTVDRALLYSRGKDPVLSGEELPLLDKKLISLLKQEPKTGTNIIMLGDEGVLDRVVPGVNFGLQQADAAVFSVNSAGYTYLGNIPRDEWVRKVEVAAPEVAPKRKKGSR